MSRILSPPNAITRRIAPTTTRVMAQRMLSASHEVAAHMPQGFYAATALDMLLLLHVAEDDANYLSVGDLALPGAPSTAATQRWVKALVAEGLLEQRGELIALSHAGHGLVTAMVESIYAAQRRLD